MAHPCGLLAADGFLAEAIYAREAIFAYVISTKGLAEELRAIRPIDRGVSDRRAYIVRGARMMEQRDARIELS
jgi:hypothetical protein